MCSSLKGEAGRHSSHYVRGTSKEGAEKASQVMSELNLEEPLVFFQVEGGEGYSRQNNMCKGNVCIRIVSGSVLLKD